MPPSHRADTCDRPVTAYRGGVETETTTVTTLVGPSGTAPGMGFVEQQQQPVDDSTTGRGTGLPLAIGALIILVVFVTILIKARRARVARQS